MKIEKKIANWKRKLHSQKHFEEGVIEELESHLRDDIEKMLSNGLAEEDAFNKAVENIGDLGMIDQEELKTWSPDNNTLKALLRNFIKVSQRQFIKNGTFNFINLGGLTVAFVSLLFIALFLYDEYGFEKMHPDIDNIYRLSYTFQGEDGTIEKRAFSSGSWAPLLKDEISGIEDYFRFLTISYGYVQNETGTKSFYEESIYWSDSNFFSFLNFPLKHGDPEDQLKDPSSIVLTEETAELFFGNENPIGKTIKYSRGARSGNFTVTGVIFNPPSNTQFQPKYIASIHRLDNFFGEENKGWITQRIRPGYAFSYLKIKDERSIPTIEKRLSEIWSDWNSERAAQFKPMLTPLADIHFTPPVRWEMDNPIDINYIYGLMITGAFILIIVLTNFVNLTTAQSSKRQKEIGLRKTLGSTKYQLRLQFFLESFVMIILAAFVSILAVYLLLPEFNNLIGKNIQFINVFTDIQFLFPLLAATLLIGTFSGLYPALFFTKNIGTENGISTFLKAPKSGPAQSRNWLVIMQFTIAITLIISTITIYNQLVLINQSKLGKNREAIIGVRTSRMGTTEQVQAFRQEIKGIPGVENSTLGMHLPRQSDFGRIDTRFKIPGQDNVLKYWNKFDADGGFAKTFELEFVAGKDFERNIDTTGVIINESVVASLGVSPSEAIGMQLIEDSINYSFENTNAVVIGVVKDFAYKSVKEKIEPLVICANNRVGGALSVKLTGDQLASIEKMEESWRDIYPERPFEYWFVDKEFERLYKQERRLGKLIPLFSGLSIMIALLGLFALTAYITELRKKEIGIRKVLGASSHGIIYMLSSQFLKTVIVAIALSVPLAWFGMNSWLEGFVYRVEVDVLVIALSVMFTLLISIITISYQSLKAAFSNPVDSLKYE